MKLGALILAAGYSSRMGSFKPCMFLGGKTLLAHCVERFQIAGIKDIMVVTGHRAPEVEVEVKTLGLQTVHNPDYAAGMFSSVQAGVKRMARYDGFFLLPVDIPLIHVASVATLLKNFDGKSVLVPTYKGKQGHPPLIPGNLVETILAHNGQGGLRAVLVCQAVREFAVWDHGTLLDCDTPETFVALQDRCNTLSAGELEKEEAIILAELSMSVRGVAHGRAVAAIAVALGERLNLHGYSLQHSLLYSGGLLHDIAKGEPDHEAAGGRLLEGFYLPKLAGIVAAHRSTPPPKDGRLTEKEIVCLADKLVRGTTRLSVQERFGEKLDRYAGDPEVVAAITKRLAEILALQELVESQTGSTIADVIAGAELA
jgi:molybdenum cofactor cytidylyltransferase